MGGERWLETGQRTHELGRAWTGSGLLVIVLGVSTNLLLTFAPDVVPAWVASAVVVCTSATLVLVAAAVAAQRLRQTLDAEAAAARVEKEAEAKRRELRGVVSAGKERVRGAEFSEVLLGARRRLIIHGVGMSVVSRERDLIRTAALGGLEIHIVMVDPRWLRRTWGMAGVLARYYDNPQVLKQVEKAYRDIETMAREVNAECAEERVRVHTYQAISPFGATIAEPGTPEVNGLVEFHVTGRSPRRIRFGVKYYQDDVRDRSVVSQMVDAISDLSGYDFSATIPDRSRGAEQQQ
jgi:4-amino-4-deoxy-L-arabinose transferase-like glycosyltransferase